MLTIVLPNFNEPNAYETMRIAKEMFPDAQIIISPDNKGRGKGWSCKKGLLASLGDTIVLLDSDGDIHPRMIKRLLPFLEDYDIVVGTKTFEGMPLHRKIITLLSRIYIKIMFWLDIDTQTGIKAFRRDAVLPWLSYSFAFDMEFLARAKRNKMMILEIPVIAKVSKSKTLKVLLITFWDSLKIWWRLKIYPR